MSEPSEISDQEYKAMMLIMAARQYDATVALFSKFADADEVNGLLERHRRGEILGPPPAIFVANDTKSDDDAAESN